MANNKVKSKKNQKKISLKPFLFIGVGIIVVNMILGELIPKMPLGLTNVLYIFGILALLLYMMQFAFENRTGKEELSEEERKSLNKKQRSNSSGMQNKKTKRK
ncbi:MAG: hypothetical protein HUJ66_08995 [Oscillospiraceae bacterium]|nr:hypothetical protein [Oscillospiraceae bacterium]